MTEVRSSTRVVNPLHMIVGAILVAPGTASLLATLELIIQKRQVDEWLLSLDLLVAPLGAALLFGAYKLSSDAPRVRRGIASSLIGGLILGVVGAVLVHFTDRGSEAGFAANACARLLGPDAYAQRCDAVARECWKQNDHEDTEVVNLDSPLMICTRAAGRREGWLPSR